MSVVRVVLVRQIRGMSAGFTDVEFDPPFVERQLFGLSVDLPTVGLQGASLCEGLLALTAFVRLDTCNREQSQKLTSNISIPLTSQ